jgi:hypothetical protein
MASFEIANEPTCTVKKKKKGREVKKGAANVKRESEVSAKGLACPANSHGRYFCTSSAFFPRARNPNAVEVDEDIESFSFAEAGRLAPETASRATAAGGFWVGGCDGWYCEVEWASL